IGAAAHADTTAAGDADGVTAMKRLCGSFSRAAGKPPRLSTTNRAWDLLEGDAVVVPITLAAMPRRNHPHRETRKSVWMCAESTATVIASGGHRGTVRHASAHTEQRTHAAEQKQRERRMTPRAGNTFTHGGHRAAASAGIQHNPKGVQHIHPSDDTVIPTAGTHAAASPRSCLRSTVQILVLVCVCVCAEGTEKETRSTRRQINTVRGTAGWQRYMRYGPDLNNHARWQHTPIRQKKKTKQLIKKHGGRVWLCVWRCGCLPALVAKEKKTRGKEMCAPPHRPSSHAHASRLPQRAVRRGPSSCVQQARRTGPSS
ncbi:hypothetical protein MOQ_006767, partial [Trypanosoma cruzi marinkellei]